MLHDRHDLPDDAPSRGQAVIDFLTAPTGELFALLRDHSVLVREPGGAADSSSPAFKLGLSQVGRFAREQREHGLRDVLRMVGVTDVSPRHRVDQRKITLHERGEGALRARGNEGVEQLGVAGHRTSVKR